MGNKIKFSDIEKELTDKQKEFLIENLKSVKSMQPLLDVLRHSLDKPK